MSSISVVIADDHELTSAGMVSVLSGRSGIDVVGTASNGIAAISLIKQHQPNCAVLDFSMPGANGLEVMLEARRWSAATRFVLVTGRQNASLFRELLDAGFGGIFLKSGASDDICAGIARVVAGETVVAEEVRSTLDLDAARSDLTPRELEVLNAIAHGLSNTKISDRLGVSVKTVESHRTNLMRKLDVNSTATLLVRAMRDGLIDISEQD